MSWYVRNLLLDRYKIRSNIITKQVDIGTSKEIFSETLGTSLHSVVEVLDFPIAISIDLEDNPYLATYGMNFYDDDYNNLILLERKINEFYENGNFNPTELLILRGVLQGQDFGSIAEQNNISRKNVKETFFSICKKLSFALGSDFTDDGYASYMINKYNLTEEQIERMFEFFEKDRR